LRLFCVFILHVVFYVDDGAFFFTTKEALQGGSEIIKEHFETFGLKMHFGQNGGESKTEAMLFPASLKEYTSENDNVKIPLRNTDGGYITTTKYFKYLGSTITPDLHEDVKICARINKETAQVAMMIKFYSQEYLPQNQEEHLLRNSYQHSPLEM
jgi:hypothetical protein